MWIKILDPPPHRAGRPSHAWPAHVHWSSPLITKVQDKESTSLLGIKGPSTSGSYLTTPMYYSLLWTLALIKMTLFISCNQIFLLLWQFPFGLLLGHLFLHKYQFPKGFNVGVFFCPFHFTCSHSLDGFNYHHSVLVSVCVLKSLMNSRPL